MSTIVSVSTVSTIGRITGLVGRLGIVGCVRRIRSSLAGVRGSRVVAHGSVTDHSILDHNVGCVIELEIGDSALRLNFEEAGITLLETLDPNALAITYSCQIKVGSISTLTFDEGAYLKLID